MNIRKIILEELLKELEDDTGPSEYYNLTPKEKHAKICMDEAIRWKNILEQKPSLYREILQKIKGSEEYSNVQNILSKLLKNSITQQEAESLQDYVVYNVENWKLVKDALLMTGYKKVV